MRELFFHNMREAFDFLEKEYGRTWYNKVLVDIFKDSGVVRDGKTMVSVKITPLEEALKNEEIDLHKILQENPYEVSEDRGKVEIEVSKDGMSAYATIFPSPNGDLPSLDDILQVAHSKGIKSGIDKETIASALRKKCVLKPFLFARGKYPVPPKNADFKLLFPASGIRVKRENVGKVDYASMYEIVWCRKGDELVEKIPAKEGEDGYDVFGKILRAEKPSALDLFKMSGENTAVVGEKIVAMCDGQPFFDGEKVIVKKVFIVSGDVDYSVGNVNFIGSVLVKGDVKEDFKVESEKDIVIEGVVEGATLQAKGSVIVKGGIFGKQKGMVRCKGKFRAKFLSDVTVFCGSDVTVDEYIMNSRLISNGNVIVRGKGWIVGGSVKASKDIVANVVGSVSKVPTHVSVGVDFDFSKEEEEVEKKIEFLMDQLKNISKLIEKLLVMLRDGKGAERRDNIFSAVKKLQKEKIDVIDEVHVLKDRLAVLEAKRRMMNLERDPKVMVKEKCFEGSRITIFDETISVHFDLGPTVFSFNKDEKRILAFPFKKWL